jgi:hypothetical protein
MAQTRAISRTLRAALGMVVVFAGYEATPAEEMPADNTPKKPRRVPKAAAGQLAVIGDLLIRLEELAPESDWRKWARETSGGVSAGELTVSQAGSLIRRLEAELAARTEPVVVEATYIDANDPVEEQSKYVAPASVREYEQQVEEELAEFADPVEEADG